jgi:hypothetical protein
MENPSTPTRIKLPSKLPQPLLKPSLNAFADPNLLKPMAGALLGEASRGEPPRDTHRENEQHGIKRNHERTHDTKSVVNIGKTLAVKRLPTAPLKVSNKITKPTPKPRDEELTRHFMEKTKDLELRMEDNQGILEKNKLAGAYPSHKPLLYTPRLFIPSLQAPYCTITTST